VHDVRAAGFSSGSADRKYKVTRPARRTSPLLRPHLGFRYIQIVMGLEVHRELRAIAKVKAQPECSVSRNAATGVDDLGNTIWRDTSLWL
jgi:hypothetical protein